MMSINNLYKRYGHTCKLNIRILMAFLGWFCKKGEEKRNVMQKMYIPIKTPERIEEALGVKFYFTLFCYHNTTHWCDYCFGRNMNGADSEATFYRKYFQQLVCYMPSACLIFALMISTVHRWWIWLHIWHYVVYKKVKFTLRNLAK